MDLRKGGRALGEGGLGAGSLKPEPEGPGWVKSLGQEGGHRCMEKRVSILNLGVSKTGPLLSRLSHPCSPLIGNTWRVPGLPTAPRSDHTERLSGLFTQSEVLQEEIGKASCGRGGYGYRGCKHHQGLSLSGECCGFSTASIQPGHLPQDDP
ncbi:hypothetical protein H8959_006559 [Pygathrix nigripes]